MPNFRRVELRLEQYRVIAEGKPAQRAGLLRLPFLARTAFYMTGSEPGISVRLRLVDGTPIPKRIRSQLVYLRPDGVTEDVSTIQWHQPNFPENIESRRPYLIQGGNHTFQLRLWADEDTNEGRHTVGRFNALDTDIISLGGILAMFGGIVAYILNKLG